jgi:hypothetical protein
MSQETEWAESPGDSSAQLTSLERAALRFPGSIRRISAAVARLRRSNPTLRQFRVTFLARNEAFNRGDFATAFALIPEDCEWHVWAGFLGGGTTYGEGDVRGTVRLVGGDEVGRFFEREVFEAFPDFHDEPVRFLAAAEGVFVVLHRAHGSGDASGVPISVSHGQVWELHDGMPALIREYSTWSEALAAAGLPE